MVHAVQNTGDGGFTFKVPFQSAHWTIGPIDLPVSELQGHVVAPQFGLRIQSRLISSQSLHDGLVLQACCALCVRSRLSDSEFLRKGFFPYLDRLKAEGHSRTSSTQPSWWQKFQGEYPRKDILPIEIKCLQGGQTNNWLCKPRKRFPTRSLQGPKMCPKSKSKTLYKKKDYIISKIQDPNFL